MDLSRDVVVNRKRPTWLHDTLKDVERHETASGTLREIQQTHRFSSYIKLMSHIIDSKPLSYEE